MNESIREKRIAMLTYLGGGFFFWLPFVTCKDSSYVKFHANQALLLFIVGAVVQSVLSILSNIFIIGFLVAGISNLVWLVLLVAMIYGMYNGYNGQLKRLPLIDKLNWELIK